MMILSSRAISTMYCRGQIGQRYPVFGRELASIVRNGASMIGSER